MFFNMEKLGDKIFLIRGYNDENDDNYIMTMVLVGNNDDNYEIKGFLSQEIMTIGSLKRLAKYLINTGYKLHAEVLKDDFNRFYNKDHFKKIKVLQ